MHQLRRATLRESGSFHRLVPDARGAAIETAGVDPLAEVLCDDLDDGFRPAPPFSADKRPALCGDISGSPVCIASGLGKSRTSMLATARGTNDLRIAKCDRRKARLRPSNRSEFHPTATIRHR